ncbi:MAG: hypothetical protein WBE74_03365 [Terracidiphilus sp.]
MKAILLAAAVMLALSVSMTARADQTAAIQVDFTNTELDPSHWILTLRSDGSAHFTSQMNEKPADGASEVDAPNVDRDVHLTTGFTTHVFEVTHRHHLFNERCESHLKVAFEGWKKFSYAGPDGSGSCTFNYSKDKEIEELGDSFEAVAETIIEGARLEKLLQHDRLGLDKEMEYLVDAAESGRAQEICTIRPILVRLADDDEVLERVRKRARQLLAQAGS